MTTLYDQVRYPSRPLWVTHPSSLGAMARLYGLTTAPAERCRVLDIGCGEGGNLLPMAAALPHSRFLGLDLAGDAVAIGAESARALSLRNIELKQANILDAGRDLGEFDYVIAHGVYTWVPSEVQERLLQLCAELLAPNGVAYISYYVYPGGYVREALRNMLLLHTKDVLDPYARVDESLKLLAALAEERRKPDPWHAVVRQELDEFRKCSPEEIFHDDLASEYHQVYFKEFIERCRAHGLDYLCEAELADMTPFGFGEQATETLNQLASKDRIQWEQYLDFFRFRKLRRTLLCRRDAAHNPAPDPAALAGLYLSSQAQRVETGDPSTHRWKGAGNAVIETPDPEVSALLQRLSASWPEAIAGSDLLKAAPGKGEAILDLCTIKSIQVHTWAPPAVRYRGGKPRFTRLARCQAATGKTTNLYHYPIDLQGDLAISLVQLGDGTRDRMSLIGSLALLNPNHSVGEIAGGIDGQISELARLGLLTSVVE